VLTKMRANRHLLIELTKRDLLSRYKGSYLGLLWSIITPLLMLGVYTFVFSVVFNAKWNTTDTSHISFGITMFAGMIIFNLFSEVLIKSTTIVVTNPNYVKKVVFPTEVFPIVLFLSALVHAGISLIVLIAFQFLYTLSISWTIILFPLVLIPTSLLAVGMGWIFAAFGVFIRDLSYMINIIVQVLMFMSPIFYPVDIVPESFRSWLLLNPLTLLITITRQVLLWGQIPNWADFILITGISFVIFIVGYLIFRKCKGAFADVL